MPIQQLMLGAGGKKPLQSTFDVSYVVIGGGGAGGGNFRGGGGGAGAFRTNYGTQGGGQSQAAAKQISVGNQYSVTIGAGGSKVAGNNGNNGSQTQFDNITSDGGAGGGRYPSVAANTTPGNGSGAGGGSSDASGSSGGTYGNDGGQGGDVQCGGGGGGAAGSGYSGYNSNGSQAGQGGAAISNSITGSAVLRAGGGGGGSYSGGNSSGGGTNGGPSGGGGGAGQGIHGNNPYQSGNDATNGTGSGGGGASGDSNGTGGRGGNGVVILRYPTGYNYTFGGSLAGSVATDGDYDVMTITDNSGTVSFAIP